MVRKSPGDFIRPLRPWKIVLLFCLVYLIVIFAINGADIKTFVTIGSCYSSCDFSMDEGCPEGTDNGYDGQYAYYIARDPAHATGCMDVPAYRYQRILLPMLGYALSFGVDNLIPVIFIAVNLGMLVFSVALLETLMTNLRVSRWYALVYGLFFGVVIGVRVSTTEPLAYGLVIVAIWLSQQEDEHPWQQALLLLAAVMAKETTMQFVAGYLLYYVLVGRWRDGLRLGLIVGIPFVIWQLYLYSWIGTFGVGSGGGGATSFEIIPYNGVWRILTETNNLAAFVLLGMLVIPSTVLPSAWGLWVTARELWQRQEYHLYTCLHLINAATVVFVPFSTYREFLGIFRFIVGLVLTHLLYAALRCRGKRSLVYSTLWIILLLFVVSG